MRESRICEATLEYASGALGFRTVGTILRTTTCGTDLAGSTVKYIVGDCKVRNFRALDATENRKQNSRRESRHVFYLDILQRRILRNDQRKATESLIAFAVNVIDKQVVDAIPLSSCGDAACIR